jgi:hypothetical protein
MFTGYKNYTVFRKNTFYLKHSPIKNKSRRLAGFKRYYSLLLEFYFFIMGIEEVKLS